MGRHLSRSSVCDILTLCCRGLTGSLCSSCHCVKKVRDSKVKKKRRKTPIIQQQFRNGTIRSTHHTISLTALFFTTGVYWHFILLTVLCLWCIVTSQTVNQFKVHVLSPPPSCCHHQSGSFVSRCLFGKRSSHRLCPPTAPGLEDLLGQTWTDLDQVCGRERTLPTLGSGRPVSGRWGHRAGRPTAIIPPLFLPTTVFQPRHGRFSSEFPT